MSQGEIVKPRKIKNSGATSACDKLFDEADETAECSSRLIRYKLDNKHKEFSTIFQL